MIKHYFKTAIRNITRFKLHSIINIGGLTIGISIFTFIMLYVNHESSFDTFHKNYEETFLVGAYGRTETTAYIGNWWRENYPEIKYITRIDRHYGGGLNAYLRESESQNLISFENIIYAEPDFLNIFEVKAIHGNVENTLKDPNTIILTETTAKKIFGDEEAINKSIEFISDDGRVKASFQVKAVIEDPKSNSSVQYSAIVSFEKLIQLKPAGGNLNEDYRNWGFYTFVSLKDGVDRSVFLDKAIKDYKQFRCSKHQIDPGSKEAEEIMVDLIPIADIPFYKNNKSKFLLLISLIGLTIILIVIINFVNLSLVKSGMRNSEIGLRKIVGAHRKSIIKQFLGETIILALFSILLSLIITELSKPLVNKILGINLEIGYVDHPQRLLLFLGGALVLGLLAGFYPAIVISKFRPVKSLKNQIFKSKYRNILQQALTIFQITLALILIIAVGIIREQIHYLKNKDIGFDNKNIIYFSSNKYVSNKYDLFKNRLLENKSIISVSRAGNEFGEAFHMSGDMKFQGETKTFRCMMADPDFVKTMGLEIIMGRNFEWDRKNEIGGLIVNETFARAFGIDSIIGARIDMFAGKQTVLGVFKDVYYESFHNNIQPGVLENYPIMLDRVMVKIDPHNTQGAIKHIHKVWSEIVPVVPLKYNFLEDKYDKLYKSEEQFSMVINFAAIFSIFLACLGLFGMVSFTSQRRKKEIGIRKANGATFNNILVLLNKGVLFKILIAAIIASPVAYYFSVEWLREFPFKASIEIWKFAQAYLLVSFIALMTVTVIVIKAARANPVDSLRYE